MLGRNTRWNYFILILVGIVTFCGIQTSGDAANLNSASSNSSLPLTLQPYNNGIFSMNVPAGWKMVIAGDGSTLAFLTWQPTKPLRQIFYFGSIGPLYMSQQQKQIDQWYVTNNGYPIAWIEMPVIQPFTAGNFFARFNALSRTSVAQRFMPQCPGLENFQVISVQPVPSRLPNGQAELVRGLFLQNGELAEGLFMATMVPYTPFMNGPGGGNGYACMAVGVAAPKNEFRFIQDDLLHSLQSFVISQAYAQDYIQRQQGVFQGIMRAGQTLRETSDIITKGWNERQKTYDIVSEKRADAIRGVERLYDPATGEVYEFPNGFYDRYNIQRNQYKMNNLHPLPGNNYNLWMTPPLNGPARLS